MNFMVTGAAGFIGSHTVDEFLRNNHTVVGVDDLSSGSLENLSEALRYRDFTFIEGDVGDHAFVSNLLSAHRVQGIVHLAGMVGIAQSIKAPEENFRLNVSAVDVVARAAIANRCGRLVFASSAAVYGIPEELPLSEVRSSCMPISPYGAAKLAAEKILEGYARAFGLECVILRYFNVYGPRQNPESEYTGVISRFCAQIANGETLTIHGDGKQTRDFIYVGDVARINLNAALASSLVPSVYNVSTGIQVSVEGLARLLSTQLGSSTRIQHACARPGDITRSCGDNTRLRSANLISGFTPLESGMENMLNHSPSSAQFLE